MQKKSLAFQLLPATACHCPLLPAKELPAQGSSLYTSLSQTQGQGQQTARRRLDGSLSKARGDTVTRQADRQEDCS